MARTVCDAASAPALVLIGPAAAGKSTLGRLAAQYAGVRFVDIDEVGHPYYEEVGWSIELLVARTDEVGRVAAESEWEQARAHAVRRVVEDYPGAVVALGAGHTSLTDPPYSSEVRRALSQVPNVVFIVPSMDRDRALAELRRRSVATKATDWIVSGHDFLAEWLDDRQARSLATRLISTENEPPEITAQWLAGLVR